MVFVTVGNAHDGSMRLLNAVEALAASGFFAEEPVVMQSGNNPDFHPVRCQCRPFLSMDEFQQHIRDARVVICHAGAGTLSSVLRTGKTPVVIPRRVKYNEIVDDHQVELLEAFVKRGLVVAAPEVEDLPAAIQEAAARPPVSVGPVSEGIRKIARAVDDLLKR
jgi:UDP-N-acetylglucosamine transferase subunit ALG13